MTAAVPTVPLREVPNQGNRDSDGALADLVQQPVRRHPSHGRIPSAEDAYSVKVYISFARRWCTMNTLPQPAISINLIKVRPDR